MSRDKYDEAIAEWDILIKLNPNNPEYHYNKGLVLKKLNKIEEAIKSVEALNLSSSKIWILILYLELKADINQSESVFKKIIELIMSKIVIDKKEFCTQIDKELKEEDLNEKEKDALLNVKNTICQTEEN